MFLEICYFGRGRGLSQRRVHDKKKISTKLDGLPNGLFAFFDSHLSLGCSEEAVQVAFL